MLVLSFAEAKLFVVIPNRKDISAQFYLEFGMFSNDYVFV